MMIATKVLGRRVCGLGGQNYEETVDQICQLELQDDCEEVRSKLGKFVK